MDLCEFEQCNICLENYHQTVSVEESDENNIKWFAKLQFTIPELEWLEEYLICESCTKQLEGAWKFKNLVLNLESSRRLGLTKKELYEIENPDFKDSCDTIDYFLKQDKEIICDFCLKIFTTQTQLRQHTLQNHMNDSQKIDKDAVLCKSDDFFTCYNCGVDFTTKDDLLQHIVNGHGKQEKICSTKTTLKYDTGTTLNCLDNFDSECKSNKQCCICKEQFSTKIDLISHRKLCRNRIKEISSVHQCSSCKNSYLSEKNLNLHKIRCGKEDNQDTDKNATSYACDICSVKFVSQEEYKVHYSSKHNSRNTNLPGSKKRRGRKPHKMFSCEICGKQFEYVKLVVEHCISEHDMEKKTVKPYTCDICGMRFASSANLDQHRHYHKKDRLHVCSLCGKGFMTKSDLIVHEYTHYNRRNYKCDKCDKAFNTNKNLRTHKLVVHTDRSLWKYGCAICKKRFPLKTNYEQHLRRHTGEKEFVCHICRKPFVSKTELKRHVNLHSNIKPFKCSICEKEYKERRTYEVHLTKVHGIGNAKIPVREKKFVCHICPSQFYDKQKLSKHICSHSGLKPFACGACDKKFTDKSYLKHHLKTIHNIIEQTKFDSID